MFNSIEEIENYFENRVCRRKERRIQLAIKAFNARLEREQEIRDQGIEFLPLEDIRAVPALAGIITREPLEKTKARFYGPSILSVSRRVAESEGQHFVVVILDDSACAVAPIEARALGLSEHEEWIPGGLPRGYDALNPQF